MRAPSPALITLAAIALALVAHAALPPNTAVVCNVTGTSYYDDPQTATISFSWRAYAPAWSIWGVQYIGGWLLSPLTSVQWDGQLNYTVTLGFYNASGSWTVDTVDCYLVNKTSGKVLDATWYEVVVSEPPYVYTTVTFTVGRTDTSRSASTAVTINDPSVLPSGLCSSIDNSTWPPVCKPYRPRQNTATLQPVGQWQALEINGLDAGKNYTVGSVEVHIPNPYWYTDAGGPDPVLLHSDTGAKGYAVVFKRFVQVKGSAAPKDAILLKLAARDTRTIADYAIPVFYFKTNEALDQILSRWAGQYAVVGYARSGNYVALAAVPLDGLLPARGILDVRGLAQFPCNTSTDFSPVEYVVLSNEPYVCGDEYVWSDLAVLVPYGSALSFTAALYYEVPTYLRGPVPVQAVQTALSAYGLINGSAYGQTNGQVLDAAAGYKKLWYARGSPAQISLAIDDVLAGAIEKISKSASALDLPFGGSLGTDFYHAPIDPVIFPPSFDQVLGQLVWWDGFPGFAVYWISTQDLAAKYRHEVVDWIGGGLIYRGPLEYGLTWFEQNATNPASLIGGLDDPRTLVGLRHLGSANSFWPPLFTPYADTGPVFPGSESGIIPSTAPIETSSPPPALFYLGAAPATACPAMFCFTPNVTVWGPLPRDVPEVLAPRRAYLFYAMYVSGPSRSGIRLWALNGSFVYPNLTVVEASPNRPLLLADTGMRSWTKGQTLLIGPGWVRPTQPLAACSGLNLGAVSYYLTPARPGVIKVEAEVYWNGGSFKYNYTFAVAEPVLEIKTDTPVLPAINAPPFNMTVRIWGQIGGARVPLFHAFSIYGEGGRWAETVCTTAKGLNAVVDQSAAEGDFWGEVDLGDVSVEVRYQYVKPAFYVLNWTTDLVAVSAPGAYGLAFYRQENGTWRLVDVVYSNYVVVNASRIFPWDPIRVVPLVSQDVYAAGGSATILRPQDALLFKLWADDVGYPYPQRSELVIVNAAAPPTPPDYLTYDHR